MEAAATDVRHLSALRAHWTKHRAFPSMAKLADVVGLRSQSGVFALVGRLADAGYLERVEGRIAPTKRFFSYRLLGPLRAGVPQGASQHEDFELSAEDYLVTHPDRTSYATVRGDSMRGVGLLDGDIVVVEHKHPTDRCAPRARQAEPCQSTHAASQLQSELLTDNRRTNVPIFAPRSTASERPELTLTRWSIKEVKVARFSEPTQHVLGWVVEEACAKVSSPIASVDGLTNSVTTTTGRTYRLDGPSQADDDVLYLFRAFLRIQDATEVGDVSDQVFRDDART